MTTTYTVTNDFTADTTAVADDVDQNFTDVLTALNAFDASNLGSGTVPLARISALTVSQIAAGTLVTEGEGINSSDNDTSIPTSAAVNDHLENHIGTGAFSPTSYASEESITFPNGLIEKSGYTARTGNTTTITFGTAFPTAVVSAIVTVYRAAGANSYTPVVQTLTTSNMTVYHDTTATGYYWFVRGR
jgi:hypothetical protein